MKGNKKILVIALLLLLLAVSYGTYAIYKTAATATGGAKAAAWVIEVNGDDIVADHEFSLADLNCGNSPYGQNGTIAPGDTCTATIAIDADGSEVGVSYVVSLGSTGNSNLSVAAHSGSSLTGNIAYGDTDGDMEATVTLDITWTAVDSDSANTADVATATSNFVVPVTVTVTQNPNPAP